MPTPDFSKIWASNSPLPEYTFSDADYLEGWDFVGSAPPTKNEFDAWFRMVDTKLKWLYDQMQATASKLYPVGSVYISFNSADPSTLFGGTWQRLKDTFLLVNGDSYAPNTTGGSATKTIGVPNMPSHNHSVSSSGSHTHSATTSSAGNHSHTRGSMNITGYIDASSDDNEALTNADDFYTGGALSISKRIENRSGGDSRGNVGYNRIDFNGANGWTGSTSTAGNHSHTVSLSGGNHTHTTNNTGGGTPLNIMPPYTTVYAWRRTA